MILGAVNQQKKRQKKSRANFSPAFLCFIDLQVNYLKSFFLPAPARPISPVPKRSMVAGSGTG